MLEAQPAHSTWRGLLVPKIINQLAQVNIWLVAKVLIIKDTEHQEDKDFTKAYLNR